MAEKNKDSLNENIQKYTDYFKEDLDAVEDELKKSMEYSSIIDSEIKKLSSPQMGMNKGGQHYLIEHIANAVQLQSQRQSLRKDRFAIKKAIMDYAAKFADEKATSSEGEFIDKINELLERDKKRDKLELELGDLEEDLDGEIDRVINEGKD